MLRSLSFSKGSKQLKDIIIGAAIGTLLGTFAGPAMQASTNAVFSLFNNVPKRDFTDACGVTELNNLEIDILSATASFCRAILAASEGSDGQFLVHGATFAGDFQDDKNGNLGGVDGKMLMTKQYLSAKRADFGPLCFAHGVQLHRDINEYSPAVW